MQCYFDNSATTKPLNSVVKAMVKALTENYGNPSSSHKIGDDAANLLESSRKSLAKALYCREDEIFFTSGGTESNNIAIFGAVEALKRKGKRIVTTSIEHPSVSKCIDRLSEQGYDVVKLPVDEYGAVKEEDLFPAITKDTILVSLAYVNSEVGSVQPIKAAAKAIKSANAPAMLHVDAVQAFGKIKVKPSLLGADLISVSAHKVHGPKGVGALYVKKGTRLVPYVLGGGHEGNIRSGTQGVPGIAGFSAAVDEIKEDEIKQNYEKVKLLKKKLLAELKDLDNLVENSGKESIPYILNISLIGLPSEVLKNYLSEHGVYVSTGSACSRGQRSVILTEMGLSNERIDSAIRISFSRFNTEKEVLYLAKMIKQANNTLRKVKL
ncbi:MAG: cysteine desulfurase [Ruminococcaceae bacterium]|nr:cysteine desulfurase [Oscillospiraceae bacterium]